MIKTPTTRTTKAKPTRAVETAPKAKAKPRTPAPVKKERTPTPRAGDALSVGETLAGLFHRHPKEAKPTKPRRRPGVPWNLKILYPKQPELRKAIFAVGSDGSNWALATEAFGNHLIKANLFTQQGDEISLVLPEPRQRHRTGLYCDKPINLLIDLAVVLTDFFTHQLKTKGYSTWRLESKLTKAVATIAGLREHFLDARVPEKSFNAALGCLEHWIKMVWGEKVERTEKTRLEDLRLMLFDSYKRYSKLPNDQIFASVGRLMKYLGFESGTDEKIRNRLKTEYYERRRKIPPGTLPEEVYLRIFYSFTP